MLRRTMAVSAARPTVNSPSPPEPSCTSPSAARAAPGSTAAAFSAASRAAISPLTTAVPAVARPAPAPMPCSPKASSPATASSRSTPPSPNPPPWPSSAPASSPSAHSAAAAPPDPTPRACQFALRPEGSAALRPGITWPGGRSMPATFARPVPWSARLVSPFLKSKPPPSLASSVRTKESPGSRSGGRRDASSPVERCG